VPETVKTLIPPCLSDAFNARITGFPKNGNRLALQLLDFSDGITDLGNRISTVSSRIGKDTGKKTVTGLNNNRKNDICTDRLPEREIVILYPMISDGYSRFF